MRTLNSRWQRRLLRAEELKAQRNTIQWPNTTGLLPRQTPPTGKLASYESCKWAPRRRLRRRLGRCRRHPRCGESRGGEKGSAEATIRHKLRLPWKPARLACLRHARKTGDTRAGATGARAPKAKFSA